MPHTMPLPQLLTYRLCFQSISPWVLPRTHFCTAHRAGTASNTPRSTSFKAVSALRHRQVKSSQLCVVFQPWPWHCTSIPKKRPHGIGEQSGYHTTQHAPAPQPNSGPESPTLTHKCPVPLLCSPLVRLHLTCDLSLSVLSSPNTHQSLRVRYFQLHNQAARAHQ